MRRRALIALACSLGALFGGCAINDAGKARLIGNEEQAQQEDFAASLRPASLLARTPAKPGSVRKLKVRVLGDAEHTRQILGWQVRAFRQIERANAVLADVLGVELEVSEIKPWARDTSLLGLEAALTDLAAFDPAQDVDVVIGLVSPLPLVTPSLHELGMAHVLGRHLVLRGMDDEQEQRALFESLGKLASDEKLGLYESRTRHKETVVLLHELGHLFGALHEEGGDNIMCADYSHQMSHYSEANGSIMALVIASRGAGAAYDEPTGRARLIAHLERLKSDGFAQHGRERLLGLLRSAEQRPGHATDRELSPPPPRGKGSDPGEQQVDDLAAAAELAQADKLDAAWEIAAPLAEARPDDARVQSFACQLEARRDPKSSAALERCKKADALGDVDPAPTLTLAYLLLEAKQTEAAFESTRKAQRRIEGLPGAGPDHWRALAQLYQAQRAPTLAERAIAHAPELDEAKTIAIAAAELRRRYPLPADAVTLGLLPDLEPEYFDQRIALEAALNRRDADIAQDIRDGIERRFPRLPSGDFSICQMLSEQRAFARAKVHCARALQRDPSDHRPRVLLGVFALSGGSAKEAITQLEAAITIAPEQRQIWSLLLAAYRVGRKDARAAQLIRDHKARFGTDLR